MTRLILVEPHGDEWMLRSDERTADKVFRSGREAENAAKRLAERIAEAGEAAEIQIRLRGGAIAGRFVCAPDLPRPAKRGAAQSPEAGQQA
jgi:Trm5-related predicted tRNA methylase